eukprot:TRINITY_DN21133_c0_g1_i1.p1 TRINITY_DN21133_c0_g1~~TRINITY_DN21133_c0_g1_i1.p1  ORF type:complete len:351 (+),score=90.87 TRINITY_DN21133_c0_g1_i1:31-1053(+)
MAISLEEEAHEMLRHAWSAVDSLEPGASHAVARRLELLRASALEAEAPGARALQPWRAQAALLLTLADCVAASPPISAAAGQTADELVALVLSDEVLARGLPRPLRSTCREAAAEVFDAGVHLCLQLQRVPEPMAASLAAAFRAASAPAAAPRSETGQPREARRARVRRQAGLEGGTSEPVSCDGQESCRDADAGELPLSSGTPRLALAPLLRLLLKELVAGRRFDEPISAAALRGLLALLLRRGCVDARCGAEAPEVRILAVQAAAWLFVASDGKGEELRQAVATAAAAAEEDGPVLQDHFCHALLQAERALDLSCVAGAAGHAEQRRRSRLRYVASVA